MLLDDALGVACLQRCISNRAVEGDVVRNKAMAHFIMREPEVLSCLFHESVIILRDDGASV